MTDYQHFLNTVEPGAEVAIVSNRRGRRMVRGPFKVARVLQTRIVLENENWFSRKNGIEGGLGAVSARIAEWNDALAAEQAQAKLIYDSEATCFKLGRLFTGARGIEAVNLLQLLSEPTVRALIERADQ